MKELRIEVPEGYVIDEENSTFECIKFKEEEANIKTWSDYEREYGNLEWLSFEESKINLVPTWDDEMRPPFDMTFKASFRKSDFTDNYNKIKRHIKAFLIINKLMPYYGGAITKKEWGYKHVKKYIIRRAANSLDFNLTYECYHYLAFHTPEQRDEFYENNEQLVKDYLMIE